MSRKGLSSVVGDVTEVVDEITVVVRSWPRWSESFTDVVGEIAEVVGVIINVVGEIAEVVRKVANVVGKVAEVVGEIINVVLVFRKIMKLVS